MGAASAHHAKRYENNVPAYRNLRLGNFMEEQEEAEGDDIIPERLRQYYLDTYLYVCDMLTEGIKIVTDATDGSKNVTEVVGDVLKVGTDATEEVAKIGVKAIGAAPSILEQKVAFAQGFGKTVQETSGQVKQGFDDVGQQFKVASAFAKTYGEFALEGLADFLQTFARRLKCNTDCQKFKEGSEKRQQCEIENCIELAQLRTVEDIVDDYDYSYGYEDTEEDNEVQVEDKN